MRCWRTSEGPGCTPDSETGWGEAKRERQVGPDLLGPSLGSYGLSVEGQKAGVVLSRGGLL